MITSKIYKELEYSETVTVGEHCIKMPELPEDPKEIFFLNEKSEDAFWDRNKALKDYPDLWFKFIPGEDGTKIWQDATLFDEEGYATHLNKADTAIIIDTYEIEMKRRTEGVHVRIKNKIVWFTGDYWFVLMWCKTKRPDKRGEYFDHREFQQEFFYIIHHVNASDVIWGCDFSKAKKTGITNLMWLYYLNKATMSKNLNLGCMNIDQDKAAKTFRDHFLYAYNGLPLALKPQWKRKSEVEGVITFAKRTTAAKSVKRNPDDELNTTVMCVPTVMHAFDVDVFTDIWYDEGPKYKSDFGVIYRSNSAGASVQDYMVGKIWVTSYTPDEDSVSFLAAKSLFYDSELKTIKDNSNGQTISKLICYHIPAYRSWGTSFDKYGKCNEKEAADKIQLQRDLLKDKPRELLSATRMYANTKREAWSIGGEGSAFDNIRLGGLYIDVEEEERDTPAGLYIPGDFQWVNAYWEVGLKNKRPTGQFCDVKFVPLTGEQLTRGEKGKVRMFRDIPKEHRNLALKYGRDEYNCLNAPPRFLYHTGGDPASQAAASEVIQGSKNAFYTMSRPDDRMDSQFGKIVTGVIHFEYVARPELANEAYEDLVKQIIYTGSLNAIEANVPDMATKLMQEGLGKFMLVKNRDGVPCIWERWMGLPDEPGKEYSLLRTTGNADHKNMIEYFMTLAKNYFYKPEEGAKDYGATIKSLRLLDKCMKLTPLDTKLFDEFMGWGYCLYSIDIYGAILMKPDDRLYNDINIQTVLRALAS